MISSFGNFGFMFEMSDVSHFVRPHPALKALNSFLREYFDIPFRASDLQWAHICQQRLSTRMVLLLVLYWLNQRCMSDVVSTFAKVCLKYGRLHSHDGAGCRGQWAFYHVNASAILLCIYFGPTVSMQFIFHCKLWFEYWSICCTYDFTARSGGITRVTKSYTKTKGRFSASMLHD